MTDFAKAPCGELQDSTFICTNSNCANVECEFYQAFLIEIGLDDYYGAKRY